MSNLGMQKQDYKFFSLAIDSKRAARKKGTLLMLLVLLYLILTAGAYLLLEFAIRTSQNQIDILESYLSSDQISTERTLAKEKKQEIQNLEQYSVSLDSFLNHIRRIDTIGTEYTGQITSAIPQDVYFDNLSMTADQLQIQGNAPNRRMIAEYLNNMQMLGLFQDVHISNITTISPNVDTDPDADDTQVATTYSFVMTCQLKDVMEE